MLQLLLGVSILSVCVGVCQLCHSFLFVLWCVHNHNACSFVFFFNGNSLVIVTTTFCVPFVLHMPSLVQIGSVVSEITQNLYTNTHSFCSYVHGRAHHTHLLVHCQWRNLVMSHSYPEIMTCWLLFQFDSLLQRCLMPPHYRVCGALTPNRPKTRKKSIQVQLLMPWLLTFSYPLKFPCHLTIIFPIFLGYSK